MPGAELDRFRKNLTYARDLTSIAVALGAQVTTAIDVGDILRASLVQAVSALDHYVHEEVRVRMLEIEQGLRPRPAAYERFRVSLESLQKMRVTSGYGWLEDEIRHQHGFQSFQQPEKIADALRLVCGSDPWGAIGAALGVNADDVKRQLTLVVDRRNKIAHEADTDPTPPQTRFPIDDRLVTDSLDFIEHLAVAINSIS